MKNYNHQFAISFSVESDNSCEDENNMCTRDELIAGLLRRIANLVDAPEVELLEACGYPEDTIVEEGDISDDPNAVCDCGDCDLCVRYRVGDEVFWTDPDEGKCSGYYHIMKIHSDEIVFLKNDEGSEVDAFVHELS